jgi:hypothetical protein
MVAMDCNNDGRKARKEGRQATSPFDGDAIFFSRVHIVTLGSAEDHEVALAYSFNFGRQSWTDLGWMNSGTSSTVLLYTVFNISDRFFLHSHFTIGHCLDLLVLDESPFLKQIRPAPNFAYSG